MVPALPLLLLPLSPLVRPARQVLAELQRTAGGSERHDSVQEFSQRHLQNHSKLSKGAGGSQQGQQGGSKSPC
jgi:hypothetical protein